jgi:uncharacterized membrane protein
MQTFSWIDRFAFHFARLIAGIGRHWLATFNTVVALYVTLPVLAPLLMLAGWERTAGWIYTVYKPTCHQMAFRSFFIGGEQWVYPRALAGTGAASFESVAVTLPQFGGVTLEGLPPDLILASRAFVGSAELGFKTAICQRDLAIFGALLIGGLLYAGVRGRVRIRPMPFWLFLLVGLGPIGLDGFSQLFGYYGTLLPFLDFFPVRESTPLLRTGTGFLFGLSVAWLALPRVGDA